MVTVRFIMKKKLKGGRLRFSIIGSSNFIKELKNIFIQYGLSDTKISETPHKSQFGSISTLNYYSYNDLKKIKNLFYMENECLKLTRKYEVFKTLKEYKQGLYNRKLKKIQMFDIHMNLIKTFNNIHDASDEINSSYRQIHRVAMGERKQTKGYIFRYI